MIDKIPILKLIPGAFGLIIAVILISSMVSIHWVSELAQSSARIAAVRTPTSKVSSEMVNQINAALSSLRGWMLLGEVRFDKALRDAWQKIRRAESEMVVLSDLWTNPENKIRLESVRTLLNEFERDQIIIRDLSARPENLPATNLLVQEATPLALLLGEYATSMIEFEKTQPLSRKSKSLLAALADFRGSLGFAETKLQSYLITPEARFKRAFREYWQQNQSSFERLSRLTEDSHPFQKRMFQQLTHGRESFSVMPAKIFALRDRENWNRASYLLRTEAAPAGEKLTRILNGMVADQYSLLSIDVRDAQQGAERYRIFLLIATLVGIALSVWIAVVIARRSSAAIRELTENAHALEQSETRIRIIHDAMLEAVVTIDDKGIIESVNRSVERLFQYRPEELLGRNVKILVQEPYRGGHDDYIGNFLKTGEAKIIGAPREVVGRRKNGSTFPADLDITEARIGSKRIFTGTVRDITERKAVDQMKSEFVSTVSHELRTPLTSIRGSLGLIRTGRFGEMPKKAERMLFLAQKNTDRLIDLVNDLLDMERIQAGKMELVLERIELPEFIRLVVENNQPFAEEHGVSFDLTASVPNATVLGDRKRLAQVLTNLLSNAAKFSPKGEKVEITLHRKNERFRIAVIDKGPGIPEEFQGRIFERFAQEDSSDTREKGGTGLGLSISRSIVKEHGGEIGFTTRQGIGSEFYFFLPENTNGDADQSVPAEDRQNAASREAGGGGHVLVLEDDADAAEVIATMLRENGLEATLAATAEEAKSLLDKKNFDAITVDIALPGQNGIAFIRELQQREHTRELPVVVVSVTASENRAELVASGMKVEDLLDKPFDEAQLLQTIKAAVGPEKSGTTKLLYVEDDEDLVAVVRSLVGSGVELTAASTLSQAKQLLHTNAFDLVILDIGLPDGSGLELIPMLRSNGKNSIPVIVFTGQDFDKSALQNLEAVLIKSESSENQLIEKIRSIVSAS